MPDHYHFNDSIRSALARCDEAEAASACMPHLHLFQREELSDEIHFPGGHSERDLLSRTARAFSLRRSRSGK